MDNWSDTPYKSVSSKSGVWTGNPSARRQRSWFRHREQLSLGSVASALLGHVGTGLRTGTKAILCQVFSFYNFPSQNRARIFFIYFCTSLVYIACSLSTSASLYDKALVHISISS